MSMRSAHGGRISRHVGRSLALVAAAATMVSGSALAANIVGTPGTTRSAARRRPTSSTGAGQRPAVRPRRRRLPQRRTRSLPVLLRRWEGHRRRGSGRARPARLRDRPPHRLRATPPPATPPPAPATPPPASPPPAPPPAPPAKAEFFGCFASTGGSINFVVTAYGRSFSQFKFGYQADCQPPWRLSGSMTYSGAVTIAADCTFSAHCTTTSGDTVRFSGSFYAA